MFSITEMDNSLFVSGHDILCENVGSCFDKVFNSVFCSCVFCYTIVLQQSVPENELSLNLK